MKPHVAILIIVPILAFSACNKNQEKQGMLKAEVIAIHDEVMPKMGELDKLARELTALADSLEADSTQVVLVEVLRDKANELKTANESMMVWMRQFDSDFATNNSNHNEIMEYFKDQKTKVVVVNEQMLSALSTSREVLEKAQMNLLQ